MSTDFHIHLTLSATGGPVEEYTYQYVPVGEFDTTAGLLQSMSLADGLVYPGTGSNSYYNPNSVLQESYTYAPGDLYTDGVPDTTYPMATDTTYTTATSTLSTTDASATPTTSTATPTIPAHRRRKPSSPRCRWFPPPQNGSGVAAQTVDFYDPKGNLVWSKDARGFLTHNIYDPTTGLLVESVEDAKTSGLTGLPTDPTTGEPLATPSGGGQNLVTDYSYDNLGRVDQTLGPAHLGLRDQHRRTASWTVYDDADHATFTAQGYATQDAAATGPSSPW